MFKVAVIGYGYWGPNIVRNFMGLPNAKVSMVADLRQERLKKLADLYPTITLTQNIEDVFKSDADAVVIATPVFSHFDLAKKALESGKHVLVEKPLTYKVEDAEYLINLANQKNKLLMVDHTYVYNPAVWKIKSLVEDGTIGNLKYFDSTRINLGLFQPDVNVLWDLSVHDLSILGFLMKEQPVSVNALGTSHTNNKLENIAYLTVKYGSGFIAHFNCSWSAPLKLRHILIGGDKRMVLFDDLQPTEKVKVYDTGYTVRNDEDKHRLLVDYRHGDIFIPQLDKTEALHNMAKDFVQCATTNKTPFGSAEAGLLVVKTLAAANISLKENGREVRL